jgi:hypothetical protein
MRIWNKGVLKPSNYVDSTLFICYHATHAARYNRATSKSPTKVYETAGLVSLAAWVLSLQGTPGSV